MAGKTFLKTTLTISVFFVVLAFAGTVHAKTIHVDDNGPADFSNIQAAIDDANDGDIIIVNPGTYTGDGNRDIDFKGKAITVRSTDPNDPNIVDLTIIDCNHLGRGFFFHSSEDGNSILSGFTIMNGQAAIGGGIYCENQSGPTIANCVIRSNRADDQESGGFGGGISGCKGTITNCTISGNTAGGMSYGSGGGLYDCNGTIINCKISNNRVRPSGNGGGLSECNGDIINCTISNNLLADRSWGWMGCGGGLYRCNGKIINSTISGNVVVAEAQAYGGGLYDCNGPIINCIISGNGAHSEILDAYGGGLDDCDGKIINCTIRWNTAAAGSDGGSSGYGGGLYGCDGTIANCTISNNSAEGSWDLSADYCWGRGGGLFGCNGTIINCTISYNTAMITGGSSHSGGGAGGGLYGCDGTITYCTIIGNTASDAVWYGQHAFGGGLRGYDGTIANYTVIGNTASDAGRNGQSAFGGGLYSCDGTISNCTISSNIAASDYDCSGGGLSGCSGTITNCTISGNMATASGESVESEATGGGLHRCNGTITNCIIWANSANTGSQVYSSSEPTYSCVQDYTGGETGNIGDDPLFIDPNNVDYHLLPGSPCIDTGDPNYLAEPNETDLDGKPRVIGGRIDMGAYEFLSQMILYVDTDATGANDGSSWADAYNYLQDALAAAYSGDEIRVSQGIYKPDQGIGLTPGDREATFQLINGVTIKGGYAGFGETDPDARDISLYETILTGDLNGDDGPDFANNGENSYHVVTGSGTDETAVLHGFTITAGKANGSWLLQQYDGGGLSNYAGSPTIGNCTFTGNWAGWYGGGIYNEGSSPTLFNCTIKYNAAEGSGSGMCNRESSNPTLTNCTFSFNVGLSYHDSFGVGMYNYKSNPILSNCAFTGNSGSLGAGMYNYYSNPTLTSCTFTGNTVHEGGGGMRNLESSPTLINCTFSGNWSDWYGVGGMESFSNSTPTLTNCILWNDMPGEISGSTVVTYSNVQGGWPGTGNIDTHPCFVSPGYWDTNGTPDDTSDDFWVDGDYHLLLSSPCIDAGDPNYIAEPNETDLDGKPRVLDGNNDAIAVVDMGAYEYRFTISAEARIVPQTINLASKGNWITCYIWLPEQYNVADIDPNSILLEDSVPTALLSVNEQQQVATAKFICEEVQTILEVGDIELTITGRLTDGTVFEGTDTIKVLNKADKK